MRIQSFSEKQRRVLLWWCPGSEDSRREAIICDGAVRSGKTLAMGLSFFCWATAAFHQRQFALCGKTIVALRRNLVNELTPLLGELGLSVSERRSANQMVVRGEGHENLFHLVGGKDEGSAALIQGATFAGVLMDEVALMPRSFVEQALARCSVEGSRLWFNCNPEGPQHWFYREWIRRAEEKNALYLHFTMADNPSLSPEEMVQPVPEGELERYCVSIDYGTANPCSFGLWGLRNGVWYRVDEYYYASRDTGVQKTDQEYVADLRRLAAGRRLWRVVVDPSAASFITALRREGFPVVKAENDVLAGIRLTAGLLKSGRLVICRPCRDLLREMALYCWEAGGQGREVPLKQNDHAMDDMRYFASTVAGGVKGDGFAAVSVER